MRAAALLLLAIPVFGSPGQGMAQNESRLARDFRVEGEALVACKNFSFGSLTDCGQTVVTGQPLHVAVGSLAPQNGIGAGLAFVEHEHFANETILNFDVDARATANGSWQAGGYLKAYRLAGGPIHVVYPGAGGGSGKAPQPLFRVAPLLNVYSQSTSLKRVDYYGLGPNTTQATHTTYGFSENITGANLILPLQGRLAAAKLAVVAEINGRFPSLRSGTEATLPSIETVFTEATAPGGSHQSGYIEPSEGLRIEPALFGDRVRLNYLVQFQQFIAPGDSLYSFRRFNGDFSHEIPLYRLVPGRAGKMYFAGRGAELNYNGPDDCTGSNASANVSVKRAAKAKQTEARPCPIVSTTEKLEGSITLRAFVLESFAGRGSVVPFYLSPTIGGSDINGTTMLASYPDYRFRGPDLLLFRGTVEHSLGRLPVGGVFMVDEGKIGLRRNDVSLNHLRHTLAAGLTIHAGGLPVVYVLFAWGGHEGKHTTAEMSTILLGGSDRPSLF